MEEKQYMSVDFEITSKATDEIKRGTKELMEVVADKVKQLAWQVADDYINTHLEVDVISNYEDAVRQEVCRMAHFWSKHKDDFYGKNIRAQIFREHKEEILPMIQSEQMDAKDEEIKQLKQTIEIMRKYR